MGLPTTNKNVVHGNVIVSGVGINDVSMSTSDHTLGNLVNSVSKWKKKTSKQPRVASDKEGLNFSKRLALLPLSKTLTPMKKYPVIFKFLAQNALGSF
ncbi:hypothetical protein AAG906_007394 [Vitis piasezkii]